MKELHIFFALGTNLGDKQKNIEDAYDKIEERIGRIISVSALYVTEPIGFESENLFVNSVCEVVSNMDIYSIFVQTQSIEREIGRLEKSQNLIYADRVIDIDLLLVDDLVINTPDLIIPHPRLHERDFVLSPLVEIAPDFIHPIFKETISELFNHLHERKNK